MGSGFVNSVLKEIKLSFEVSIVLKQTVVHWVEEELLGMWEDVFLGVLKRVMTEIEGEALKEAKVL